MSKKRNVEVFVGGCALCAQTVEQIEQMACESCEVTVHDLAEGRATNQCVERARILGVTRVPAVAVDGGLAECCRAGNMDHEALRRLGVGRAA